MTEEHPLISLVYCSSATHPFDERELADLLAVSRSNNDARDVTGLLLYRDGEFVQILEGDRYDVEAVMASITADQRHTDVRILLEEPLHERRFEQWTMGYQKLEAPIAARSEGFRDSFDDLRMGERDMIGRALMELTMWFRVRESGAAIAEAVGVRPQPSSSTPKPETTVRSSAR
ncbi:MULTISPECIES: BLUF domain-containing protein [Microbacterium]|uniref:BLUF domain-containing protein n=1 Tax=Microbacterium maritypicum TaxID=33918 RepID=A0ACD4B561_MICMQ|nr:MULTISPECIES: BLUF domain-containing protein [Microbacterium]MBP5801127.1 BLUF domain-containing protein [Microbacterium liquefaciens]UTT52483.1 BLUF domain-containing protein [Microbacterium liquefaciens]